MAWNDTFSQATDWADIDFINQFREALVERDRAANNSGSSSIMTAAVAGDDFSAASFILGIQQDIEGMADGVTWVSKSYWNGASYSTITDYHGKAALQFWSFVAGGGSQPNVCGSVLNIDGWTRKYPREIDTLASGTYTDASAFANGHKARNRDNGRIYERSAGSWVASADIVPDTVTAYGNFAAGDYIGPWLWNEMRDVLNLFDWLEANVTELSGEFINADTTDQASEAAAKTAAESDYDGTSPTSQSAPYTAYGSTEMQDSGGGQFDAFIETASMDVRADGIQTQYSSEADFYATTNDYGSAASNEYDAMDLNLVDTLLGKFASGASVNGSGISATVKLGTMTRPPRWPTYSSPNASRGWLYDGLGITSLVRCTGFTYKA